MATKQPLVLTILYMELHGSNISVVKQLCWYDKQQILKLKLNMYTRYTVTRLILECELFVTQAFLNIQWKRDALTHLQQLL